MTTPRNDRVEIYNGRVRLNGRWLDCVRSITMERPDDRRMETIGGQMFRPTSGRSRFRIELEVDEVYDLREPPLTWAQEKWRAWRLWWQQPFIVALPSWIVRVR